jgi:hypothetical protein
MAYDAACSSDRVDNLPEYGVTIGAAENTETEDAFGLAIMQVVDVVSQHVEPIG